MSRTSTLIATRHNIPIPFCQCLQTFLGAVALDYAMALTHPLNLLTGLGPGTATYKATGRVSCVVLHLGMRKKQPTPQFLEHQRTVLQPQCLCLRMVSEVLNSFQTTAIVCVKTH